MKFTNNAFWFSVIALIGLVALVGGASCAMPASAGTSTADCTQWAIKIIDLKPTPDPDGGDYYLVPSGWEPIEANLLAGGTVMRKCVKP